MTKNLNSLIREIVAKIASWLPEPEKSALMQDLMLAQAIDSELGRSVVKFDLAGYTRPTYTGQVAYSSEASTVDADGESISIILYKDPNGRLLELEFIRWDGSETRQPSVSEMRPINYLGKVHPIGDNG